ncbi:hypothetical protein [Rhizobium sp. C4]|uniref:hypothetical protein n=1 Tax=Rhizobium sp. C4 TaxID=1349800 RepID=UPI001E53655B|nr:hypothetical protein [Rhizobium sp. C4]MCD2175505.1 hypothetical protein [Rhizobium sp. C4]
MNAPGFRAAPTSNKAVRSSDAEVSDINITINGAYEADGGQSGAPSQVLLSCAAASGAGLNIIGDDGNDGFGNGVSATGEVDGNHLAAIAACSDGFDLGDQDYRGTWNDDTGAHSAMF